MNKSRFEENLRQQRAHMQANIDKDQATTEDEHTTGWGYFDERAGSFAITFAGVIEEGYNYDLSGFLRGRFPKQAGNLVMLEVGGPGYNLANDLRGEVSRSFAVCLTDKHLPLDGQVLSPDLQHRVLEGDFTDPKIYRQLVKDMGSARAHFLIERMKGVWDGNKIVERADFLFHNLKKYYRLTAPDSVMLIELPQAQPDNADHSRLISSDIEAWQSRVNADFKRKLLINYQSPKILRIDRFPGSPQNLPV